MFDMFFYNSIFENLLFLFDFVFIKGCKTMFEPEIPSIEKFERLITLFFEVSVAFFCFTKF